MKATTAILPLFLLYLSALLPAQCVEDWVAAQTSPSEVFPWELEFDAEGNLYLALAGKQALEVLDAMGGGIDLQSGSLEAMTVVAKYSPAGKLLWATPFFGHASVAINPALAVSYDRVYLWSGFRDTLQVEEEVLTSDAFGLQMFGAALKLDGTLDWVRTFPTTGISLAYGMTIDQAGKLLVTGYFSGTVQLTSSGQGLISQSINSSFPREVFVLKLHQNGDVIWFSQSQSPVAQDQYNRGWPIVVDGNNDVIVGGYYSTQIKWGAADVVSPTPYPSFQPYLAKLDGDDGHLLWLRHGANTQGDVSFSAIYGLAVGPNNEIYAAGSLESEAAFDGVVVTPDDDGSPDALLLKYSQGGNLQWAKVFGGLSEDCVTEWATGIHYRPGGTLRVVANLCDSIPVPGGFVRAIGSPDVAVADFNLNGDLLNLYLAGSRGPDASYNSGFDSEGNFALIASVDGDTVFFPDLAVVLDPPVGQQAVVYRECVFPVRLQEAGAGFSRPVLWPNPTDRMVTVDFGEEQFLSRWRLLNALGQTVCSGKFEPGLQRSEWELSWEPLPGGWYLLELELEGLGALALPLILHPG